MASLTTRDLRSALELAADCAEVRTAEDVGGVLLPQLARHLAAEVAVHTQADLRRTQEVMHGWPDGALDLPWAGAYQSVVGEHPFVRAGLRAPLPDGVRLSDLVSQRQWRSSALYAESHRRLGADDQMLLVVSQRGDVVHGLTVLGSGRPFTERQRDLLLLCRPHLTAALHRALAGGGRYRAVQLRPQPRWVELSGEALGGQRARGAGCLTGAERRVMELVSQGLTSGQAARRLGLSPRTVSKHLEHVHDKLRVTNRVAAVKAYEATQVEPRRTT